MNLRLLVALIPVVAIPYVWADQYIVTTETWTRNQADNSIEKTCVLGDFYDNWSVDYEDGYFNIEPDYRLLLLHPPGLHVDPDGNLSVEVSLGEGGDRMTDFLAARTRLHDELGEPYPRDSFVYPVSAGFTGSVQSNRVFHDVGVSKEQILSAFPLDIDGPVEASFWVWSASKYVDYHQNAINPNNWYRLVGQWGVYWAGDDLNEKDRRDEWWRITFTEGECHEFLDLLGPFLSDGERRLSLHHVQFTLGGEKGPIRSLLDAEEWEVDCKAEDGWPPEFVEALDAESDYALGQCLSTGPKGRCFDYRATHWYEKWKDRTGRSDFPGFGATSTGNASRGMPVRMPGLRR